MSKRENDANNIFRPSDGPLTEHEKEQIALRLAYDRATAVASAGNVHVQFRSRNAR